MTRHAENVTRDRDQLTVTVTPESNRDGSRSHGQRGHGVTAQVGDLSPHRDSAAVTVPTSTERTPSMAQLAAITVTAPTYVDALGRLQEWAKSRSPELSIASVTFTGEEDVTAVVVFADRDPLEVRELDVTIVGKIVRAADKVEEFYRQQLAAGVTPADVSPSAARDYAARAGYVCTRQAASKKIGKLRKAGR